MIETANGTAPSRRHSNTALGLGLLRPRSATWGSRGSRVACREVAWLGSGQPTIHRCSAPGGAAIQGEMYRGSANSGTKPSR
jgi:hypothetical protein